MGFKDSYKLSNPSPCYKCDKRFQTCHDSCEKYKHFKQVNADIEKERVIYKNKKVFTGKASLSSKL